MRVALCSVAGTSRCAGLARRQAFQSTERANFARRLVSVKAAAGTPTGSPAASAAATLSSSGSKDSSSQPSWNIKMLYDGDCPLCMREVDMLMRRDAGKGRIAFVDIAAADYNPADNAGITFEQAMERIHAIEADGTIVTDVQVFQRLYEEVGLGWVYGFTKYPALLELANKVYGVWAKYRLPVTGRPDLEQVLAEKKSCRVDGSDCS